VKGGVTGSIPVAPTIFLTNSIRYEACKAQFYFKVAKRLSM
jgi:hypothetical protein